MGNRSYEIKIKGFLNGQNYALLEDSEFFYQDGVTTIICPVRDQSALHGVLNRIRDLNLELISLDERRDK
jgi:hypothetical protein